MFGSRKLINNFIFSNNHQCNYTKTISRLRPREYRRIETLENVAIASTVDLILLTIPANFARALGLTG